jgi:hypothetical protein
VRLPDESDEAFRERAERSGIIAKTLVAACLQNWNVQELIAAGTFTESRIRQSPLVRVEFEQAIAIGGIGETLCATRGKHWGDGPWIMPLESEDDFFPERITYLYRANSLYNQRFEQRQRMKQLLGKNRKLVGNAKYFTKTLFLQRLTRDHAAAIRRCLNVEPGKFWPAVNGKVMLNLPKRPVQKEFDFK